MFEIIFDQFPQILELRLTGTWPLTLDGSPLTLRLTPVLVGSPVAATDRPGDSGTPTHGRILARLSTSRERNDRSLMVLGEDVRRTRALASAGHRLSRTARQAGVGECPVIFSTDEGNVTPAGASLHTQQFYTPDCDVRIRKGK